MKIVAEYHNEPDHQLKGFLNRKLDWGNWDYGWHGSYVVVGVSGNHVYLRTYVDQDAKGNKNVISEKIYRYTIRGFYKKLGGDKTEDFRSTNIVIDLNTCKIIGN